MVKLLYVRSIEIKSMLPANCQRPIPMVPKPKYKRSLAYVFFDLDIKKKPKIHPKMSNPK